MHGRPVRRTDTKACTASTTPRRSTVDSSGIDVGSADCTDTTTCDATSTDATDCTTHTVAATHTDSAPHIGTSLAGDTVGKSPYDYAHRQRRIRLLPKAYGKPCPMCGEIMERGQDLDLDHTTPLVMGGTTGDRITHSSCNRRAGQRLRGVMPDFAGPSW